MCVLMCKISEESNFVKWRKFFGKFCKIGPSKCFKFGKEKDLFKYKTSWFAIPFSGYPICQLRPMCRLLFCQGGLWLPPPPGPPSGYATACKLVFKKKVEWHFVMKLYFVLLQSAITIQTGLMKIFVINYSGQNQLLTAINISILFCIN